MTPILVFLQVISTPLVLYGAPCQQYQWDMVDRLFDGRTMDNGQLPVASFQWTVDNVQWTADSGQSVDELSPNNPFENRNC